MGINLLINQNLPKISCSFDEWNNFKNSAVRALIRCIEEIIILAEYKKNIDSDTANNLELDLHGILNDDIIILSSEQIDTLIYFDLAGLYYLFNKDDYQGYYSIGNSYDIHQTLLILKDYFKFDNQIFLNDIINIFQSSFIVKQKVFFN